MRRVKHLLGSGIAVLSLTACGSGTGSNPVTPPASPPPASPPPASPNPLPPSTALPAPAQHTVAYLGGAGNERFNAVVQLSDGSFIVGGQAQNLDWVPAGVPKTQLSMPGLDSASSGNVGFIAQFSSDLGTLQRVISLPAGTARDVFRIRTTSAPGQTTGEIYISGNRDGGSSTGYYIARLNVNFVTGVPTLAAWTYNVTASGDHQSRQPWDVGGDGKVVFATGTPINPNWASIERLTANGARDLVQNWHAHWGAAGEWDGTPASSYTGGTLEYSAIVMKAGRKGSLRSGSQADFDLKQSDGNGRTDRKGAMPDDYYFDGPCDLGGTCATTGPGYTGYTTSGTITERVGGIVVDRRNNDIYFGYGTQTRLPNGNPDFEPAVVAMTGTGAIKWWTRLYSERTDKAGGGYNTTSSPDQYVDHLALDYAGNTLVVLARSHGNNVINFWGGNTSVANPSASGFQNSFSGTSGNIHVSWLGKFGLQSGVFGRSTWVAEWAEGANIPMGTPSSDPNMDGWPSPNSGWPDLNTTRVQGLEVDSLGRVYLTGVGRRTITTASAFQKMIKPSDGKSAWNNFARVYSSDLSTLVYSSLLTGSWDPVTQAGADNTYLGGLFPIAGGLITVGYHTLDSGGNAAGNAVPTVNRPGWGQAAPVKESGIIGALKF